MHFKKGMWIIGGSGIGSALAKRSRQAAIDVKMISRPYYDMTQLQDVKRLFDSVDRLPSVIVNTIGMLHDEWHHPEKSLSAFKADWFHESIRVNALPVMWIAQCLSAKMNKQCSLIFTNLSARISSLSDNHLGGWYSYRASKCVLNMFIKNISIEWSRRFPKTAICGYHPGTVDTYLSKPFIKNIQPKNLFSPERAADYLFAQLTKITPAMSGNLLDWRGERIEF